MGAFLFLLAISTGTYAWFTYGRKQKNPVVGRLITLASLGLSPLAIAVFIYLAVQARPSLRGFPPTKFGYQPPPDADVRSWNCASLECEEGEHAPDPRTWPRACPKCGSNVVSGVLSSGQYAHDAERFELNYRMQHPKDEHDLSLATRKDIVWRYKNAARDRDVTAARRIRAELEAAIEQKSSDYGDYGDRVTMHYAALRYGLVEEDSDLLRQWYVSAPIGDQTNSGRVANVRMLAESTISYLESPSSVNSPAAPELWESLKRLMSMSNEIATADMNTGFARLRQRLP
jgi:hypothetical protein